MAKATVFMRAVRAGDQLKHDVPNGTRVVVNEGVLLVTNQNGLEQYFAAPVELVDHVQIEQKT